MCSSAFSLNYLFLLSLKLDLCVHCAFENRFNRDLCLEEKMCDFVASFLRFWFSLSTVIINQTTKSCCAFYIFSVSFTNFTNCSVKWHDQTLWRFQTMSIEYINNCNLFSSFHVCFVCVMRNIWLGMALFSMRYFLC